MRWQIATWQRRLNRLSVLATLALVFLPLWWPPSVPARADAPDWEATPLTGKALRLFTPASGALFAQIDTDLYRSDDGATWVPITLPPQQIHLPNPPSPPSQFARHIAIDATNPTVMCANEENGLYRSQNAGLIWDLVLPTTGRVWHYFTSTEAVVGDHVDVADIAVSPADPHVLYAGLRNSDVEFQFLRSRDNGVSWEQIEERTGTLCYWIMPVLEPHLTSADRLFRTAVCAAGRVFNAPLNESADQGQTWTTSFGSIYAGGDDKRYLTPAHLVGGSGATPARYYMAAQRDFRLGGSALLRSDDGAVTWTEMLIYHGGGSDTQLGGPTGPNVRIGGLAYDPMHPDTVYIGLIDIGSYPPKRESLGMHASRDAGVSWSDLGRSDIGAVNDLALSVDGATLYAATDQGVFQMHLTPQP